MNEIIKFAREMKFASGGGPADAAISRNSCLMTIVLAIQQTLRERLAADNCST
ncbi:MAG TPA: hypothetical protein VFO40_20210 [Chthoniobacterales bacterium]|nr:hypothetical protein [Chthoniobacterales bacterium]